MLVVLTETYCNKLNIQITQLDDFIQIGKGIYPLIPPPSYALGWKNIIP